MQRRSAVATMMTFLVQAILYFWAFICLFGVGLQVADKGGGRSGIQARSQITVWDRIGAGAFFVCIGSLCIAGAMSLSRRLSKPPTDGEV